MHKLRGCCCWYTCACIPSVSEELSKSRYVQVFDNKIEINEPDSYCAGCCTTVVRDRITTIHFDRALVQNASRAADCCSPQCTHGDCCPECWGAYGETLVLSSDRPGCCAMCSSACSVKNTSTVTHMSNSACPFTADLGMLLPFSWCCANHKLVFGLDNAAELAEKINAARQLKAGPRAQEPF